MSIKGKTIHLLTPMYGGNLQVNYHTSVLRLQQLCMQTGVGFNAQSTWNESLISRARNRLVDEFIKKSKSTHALFIDADIGFEPSDIFSMLEMDRDIVGAGCVKKSLNWNRVQAAIKKNGREFKPEELARIAGDYVVNFEPFKGEKEMNMMEPQEVRHLGTGLLMIKREVFEKFMEAYPDRWYESPEDPAALPGPIFDFFRVGINPETRKYDSEDYWFCQDCKSIGLKVWLAPWMKTSHHGAYTFVGDLPAVALMSGRL